jgi:hypothetical protein
MKKYLLINYLIFLITVLSLNQASQAQCPGCTIDNTCYVAGGGLCPDSLPGGTQGVYYDQNVTAYLPSQIDAGPFSGGVLGIVPLVSVKINSISGLPFGLNWQSNKANNTYYPSSGENHGCVKICGTPLSSPGVYNIIVNVTAVVDAGGILGLQSSQIDFNFQMVIFAGTSGNLAYNYSPGSACDSGQFSFTPNLTATLPQIIEYNWNFGTSTYTGMNPPDINFLAPGFYPVTTTVNYYDLRLTSLSVSLQPGVDCWFAGDIEEASCGNGNVDFFFTYNSGSFNFTSNTISNNPSVTWTNLNSGQGLPINGTSFSFNFFDDDNGPPFGSPDDNGGVFTGTLTGPGTFSFSTVAITSGGGGTTGTYTISQVLASSIVVTDTIKVYASPAIPTITSTTNQVCKGDSTLLSTTSTGYIYEWYKNGLLIPNSNFQQIYVKDTGNYFLRIIDPVSACYSTSNTVQVSYYAPVPSNFAITYNNTGGYLQSNLTGSYSYQWLFYSGGNWVSIPAPAGVQSTLTPTANGQYMLIATTPNGCKDTSNVYTLTLSLNDIENKLNLLVFPVPAIDKLNIQMNLEESSDISIRMFDLVGKVILHEQWNQQYGWINNEFDLHQIPSGTYLLDIETKYGMIRRKIIKQ